MVSECQNSGFSVSAPKFNGAAVSPASTDIGDLPTDSFSDLLPTLTASGSDDNLSSAGPSTATLSSIGGGSTQTSPVTVSKVSATPTTAGSQQLPPIGSGQLKLAIPSTVVVALLGGMFAALGM